MLSKLEYTLEVGKYMVEVINFALYLVIKQMSFIMHFQIPQVVNASLVTHGQTLKDLSNKMQFVAILNKNGMKILKEISIVILFILELRNLKKKFPHMKILASVGGWTYSKAMHNLMLTKDKIELLTKSCVDLINKYPDIFDG